MATLSILVHSRLNLSTAHVNGQLVCIQSALLYCSAILVSFAPIKSIMSKIKINIPNIMYIHHTVILEGIITILKSQANFLALLI